MIESRSPESARAETGLATPSRCHRGRTVACKQHGQKQASLFVLLSPVVTIPLNTKTGSSHSWAGRDAWLIEPHPITLQLSVTRLATHFHLEIFCEAMAGTSPRRPLTRFLARFAIPVVKHQVSSSVFRVQGQRFVSRCGIGQVRGFPSTPVRGPESAASSIHTSRRGQCLSGN